MIAICQILVICLFLYIAIKIAMKLYPENVQLGLIHIMVLFLAGIVITVYLAGETTSDFYPKTMVMIERTVYFIR